LDTILTELLELEEQLSGEAGDRLVLGLPTLPLSKPPPSTKDLQPSTKLPSPQMVNQEQQQQHVQFQYITGNSNVNGKSFSNDNRFTSLNNSHLNTKTNGLDLNDCFNPADTDSAFGDSSSTESTSHIPAGGNALLLPKNVANCNSEFSSADSFLGSTPSPTRQVDFNFN